jgi:hypothetical protein
MWAAPRVSPLRLLARIAYQYHWRRLQRAYGQLFHASDPARRARLLSRISGGYSRLSRLHRTARPAWPHAAADLAASARLAMLAACSETGTTVPGEGTPQAAAAWRRLAGTRQHSARGALLSELAVLTADGCGLWAASTLRVLAASEHDLGARPGAAVSRTCRRGRRQGMEGAL